MPFLPCALLILCPLFKERNWGVKQGLGIHNCWISENSGVRFLPCVAPGYRQSHVEWRHVIIASRLGRNPLPLTSGRQNATELFEYIRMAYILCWFIQPDLFFLNGTLYREGKWGQWKGFIKLLVTQCIYKPFPVFLKLEVFSRNSVFCNFTYKP
jgi:hypothetical protein